MRAVVQERYGPPGEVLSLADIDPPGLRHGEVLVRVHAASVHPDVWHVVTGLPYVLRVMGSGLRRPKTRVPGTDLAGRVEAVGEGVTRFAPGDDVFGESVAGYSWVNGGAFAEYAAVPESALVHKPGNISYEQAAAVPSSGLIAVQGLVHQGRLRAGQHVLVNGAGGGVGSIAVQLAKALGAEVTGVDAPAKADAVRSLGADHVIDYTREDFTRGDARYDLILDMPGNHSFAACRRVLTPTGIYVLIGHDRFGTRGHRVLGTALPRFGRLLMAAPFVGHLPKLRMSLPPKVDSLTLLATHLAAGRLTPLIDRTFPLAEVPAAIDHLGGGHVRGKVVIVV